MTQGDDKDYSYYVPTSMYMGLQWGCFIDLLLNFHGISGA